MAKQMSVAEAAERLLNAVLVQFADRDDDELIQIRAFMGQVAQMMDATIVDPDGLPEWETVGWLRERIRDSLAELANGGQP